MARTDPRSRRHWETEKESTLTEHRLRKGFTEQQLGDMVGEKRATINLLARGLLLPIYASGGKKGMVKPVVEHLEAILGVSASDLFPLYICGVHTEFTDAELIDYSVGGHSLVSTLAAEKSFECLEHTALTKKLLWSAVRRLSTSEKIVVIRRLEGDTLEEAGKVLGCTRERARQIESSAYRRLRNKLYRTGASKQLAREENE